MTGQQARMVAVAASFVLALIFGAITGFVAPSGEGSDTDTPTDSRYSESVSPGPATAETPDNSEESPKKSPTPSKSNPKKDEPSDNPDDEPGDEPTSSPSKPTGNPTDITGAGVPTAGGTGGLGGGDDSASGTNREATGKPQKLAASDGGESFAAGPAAIAFLGALITGLAVVAVFSTVRASGGGRPTRPDPQPGSTRVMPAIGDDPGSSSDRATLVEALIYVRDRATSAAISDRVGQALSETGVVEISPVGQPFDPAQHEAGGATLTLDPRQAGTIAEVEVVGYIDRDGTVIRPPVVTVYRTDPGPEL